MAHRDHVAHSRNADRVLIFTEQPKVVTAKYVLCAIHDQRGHSKRNNDTAWRGSSKRKVNAPSLGCSHSGDVNKAS